MRQPSDTDFFIDVSSVGKFRFARRTYGDKIRVRSEYLRLVQDVGDEDPDIRAQAAIIAAHKVLCVEAPSGWDDLENLDMLAIDNAEGKVLDVYLALKAKEDSFRQAANKGGAHRGAGNVPDDQLLVPQAVQPEPA
ncbi:hypothetical protein [Burkholderia sp. Ac-20349]|uniref:hypothetical protein n=1 Tax=Burkholderia sp. Ac-20349 TaxID=2703893 RepID=UPI00197C9483|nr:hypothetical protein [Burkholderia sp. Ac-20349]MBN3839273.1 hypothetical protein [Burkholderia sp. Ac-20349]